MFFFQAQDSSEMRKKQMLKTKIEEGNEPKQERDKDSDNSKKVSNETVVERNVVKEADKKVIFLRPLGHHIVLFFTTHSYCFILLDRFFMLDQSMKIYL